MLAKLARAFDSMRKEVAGISEDVRLLKHAPRPKDGQDGASPDLAALAEAAAKLIPTPKDGQDGASPDLAALAEAAAKLIPTPKDGRDGISPTVRDIVGVTLSKIPTPKDGASPDPAAIAKAAAKLIPTPKNGVSPTPESVARKMPAPKRGKDGKDGKDGTSVTDVQLKNNELFVSLGGVKSKVGKILVPAAPFSPGGPGGGGGRVYHGVERVDIGIFRTSAIQEPTGLGDAGKIKVNFGLGGDTPGGEYTVSAEGVILRNYGKTPNIFGLGARLQRSGSPGVSEIMGRLMYAPDGIELNAVQIGDTFGDRIDDDDTVWREEFTIPFNPAVGSVLWFEVARNPGSHDSGGLGAVQPAGDLSSWNASDSATLTISKDVLF